MKKIFLFLMAITVCASLCSCCCSSIGKLFEDDEKVVFNESSEASENSEIRDSVVSQSVSEGDSEDSSEEESSEPEVPADPYPEATAYIAQGNYEEAYKILYAARSDAEAAKRLESFFWCNTKTIVNMYDSESQSENYVYDSKGNLVNNTTYFGNNKHSETKFTYDSNNRLIKKVYSDVYIDSTVYEYFYDENGNLIKQTERTDGYSKNELYTYDANGNLLTASISVIEAGESWIEKYTYDSNGYLIEKGKIYDGEYVKEYEYINDANGNCIKESDLSYDLCAYYIDYTYDANGNCIKEVHTNSEDNEKDTYTYTYDSDNRMIEENFVSEYYSYTYEYVYDDNGNLVKVHETGDGAFYEMYLTGYICFYKAE